MSRFKTDSRGEKVLVAIAMFKLVKAILFLAITFGAIRLLHKDVGNQVEQWIDALRVDPENKYIAALLTRLKLVRPHELKELSFLTGFYAALFLAEGIGLAFRKRWAEYLTIVTTGSFIPIEVYEIYRHPTPVKALVTFVNVGVVIFLVRRVRHKNSESKSPAPR